MAKTDRVYDAVNEMHGAGHDVEHHSEHGQESAIEPLGPVDLMAWAYAIAGGAVGVIVALALWVASAT